MIEHIWTVLCTRSIVATDSNNVSLIEVVEQIALKDAAFPTEISINLDLVTLWTRAPVDQPSQGRARVVLANPSHKELRSTEYSVNLSEVERHRTTLRLHGLPVEQVGYHYLFVQLQQEGDSNWETVVKIPLKIALES